MDHRTFRTSRARDLRQTQTFAENKLWQALRGGRLDGHKFRGQHPIGRYIADFACEKLMLVIELDGGVHDDDAQRLRDEHRHVEIEALGWSILRFRNEEVTVNPNRVLARISDHANLARP
jgi:very-short-patch-repair endonuclease